MLRQRYSLPNFAAGLLTCLCSLSLSLPGAAGELPAPAAPATTNGSDVSTAANPALEEALRELKEQQTSTFQALDLIRHQTESALHQNACILSNQLAQFGTALAGNSAIQLKFMRETERRTLQVTMLILLAVLLGVGSLVLVAARTFNSLVKRLSVPASAPNRPEVPQDRVEKPASLLDQSAASAYTAALLDVETRIAALERKPVSDFSGTSTTRAPAPARRSPPVASRTSVPAKPASSSSLAMTLGDGQAIVFLPREGGAGASGRIGEFFHRIGRLFAPRKSSNSAKTLPGPRPMKC